jgi:rhamnosyltransferase
MKRLIILSHYDRDNVLDPYVVKVVKALRDYSSKFVFVTTSKLDSWEIDGLKNYKIDVIERENVGFDFMSYKVGVLQSNLQDYDEVILCNDSLYGPLRPLDKFFEEMEKRDCDFWGLTDNHDHAYHLQSHWLAVRRKVIDSGKFIEFVKNIEPKDKGTTIQLYEVGFTQFMLKCGFKPSVFAFVSGFMQNQAWYKWKELLEEYNMPFIKARWVESPLMYDVLLKETDYDLHMLKSNLKRVKRK